MTKPICTECGSEHVVYGDGSSLCPLCYVHGTAKAKRIAATRRRELAQAHRNSEATALRRAFA